MTGPEQQPIHARPPEDDGRAAKAKDTASGKADSPKDDTVIIGAGLAGLACAITLHEAGLPCRVIEAGDDVGGRVRTDRLEGFTLDRGFHVCQTAYPAARAFFDLQALDLKPFEPGAIVQLGDGPDAARLLADPWRSPLTAARHLFRGGLLGGPGSAVDRLRLAAMRRDCLRHWRDLSVKAVEPKSVGPGSTVSVSDAADATALTELRRRGFSETFIDRFLRPWFAGVFLEPDLNTHRAMLRFLFGVFASGDASLPAKGIAALPRQLADRLPRASVQTGRRVIALEPGRLQLADGAVLTPLHTVVALDEHSAQTLIGAHLRRKLSGIDARQPRTTCHYFAADRPPHRRRMLMLNGTGRGPVTSLNVLSNVAPCYAPPGQSLIAVSSLADSAPQAVVDEVARWFDPGTAAGWRHLRTDRIEHALPDQSPRALAARPRAGLLERGLYLAGDWLGPGLGGSVQAALDSGRRAAEAVLAARAL